MLIRITEQSAEYVLVEFAERLAGPFDFTRRSQHFGANVLHLDFAELLGFDLDDIVACCELRVLHNIGYVVDRTGRDTFAQYVKAFLQCMGARPLGKFRVDLLTVRRAVDRGLVIRMVDQILAVDLVHAVAV